MQEQKRFLIRALIGGAAGVALAALCHKALFSPGFSAPALCQPLIDLVGDGAAVVITYLLCFALGAAVGLATLPFADEGRALVVQSLGHFALTAGICALLLGLCFGVRQWPSWLLGLGLLALFYVLVWLARWVGWYAEADAIRKKLGLAPAHSLFHWRETLPYVPFAALLCLLLPFVLRLCDAGDVPVLSGLLYPYLLLPVGAFCSALSLGKRQGFCPLYPVACAGFLFCFALLARLVSNVADTDMLPIAFLAALAGGLTGAALRRRRGGAGE